MTRRMHVVATAPDIQALRDELDHPGCGGYCSFEGRVRDSNAGAPVQGLDYQAYAVLAESEGERIIEEARFRFDIVDARCVHRIGALAIGDLAIWIGVAAPHRDAAFAACRYIIDEAKRRLPVWKKEYYVDRAPEWVVPSEAGSGAHVATGTTKRAASASFEGDAAGSRQFEPDYSRQTRLPGFGAEGQRRLADSRVLVIGAGGLGASALSYLAGAGVGTLGIVDGDRLEASNLHRQVIYSAADVGEWKVDLAARRLRELNPAVRVEVFRGTLSRDGIEATFRQFDLVLECTDDASSKYLCSDAAVATQTPIVFASIYQYEGQLHAWSPGSRTPCMRCLWPEPPPPGAVGTCAGGGVLGPVPGILGALQATEAIKRIVGLPGAIEDSMLLVNLLDYGMQRLGTTRDGECRTAGRCVPRTKTDMPQSAAAIAAGGADELEIRFDDVPALRAAGCAVIDIRTAAEIADSPAPVASVTVPMHALLADDALAVLASSAPEAREFLIVCAHGQRSLHVTRHLRELGAERVWSLSGGLARLQGA
jgi:molybdopterin/thiamine biosynthesis adenylyltransferase/molybdopterin synthase catalytic subunit/rhodanese-related sulfurtransferase